MDRIVERRGHCRRRDGRIGGVAPTALIDLAKPSYKMGLAEIRVGAGSHELMQLIQYSPSTETVLKRPLLIAPPWINKFYILDLQPKNSFVKWAVERGYTVFVVSWVNPDEHLAKKTFEDYVLEGPIAALGAIKQATGEAKVHTIGYCVAGTTLASTLALLEARVVGHRHQGCLTVT